MGVVESFLLGLIQGLTEFLPISSSGHLALAEALLGGKSFGNSILFTVIVHFGTLCSIVVYYREKLQEIFVSLWQLLTHPGESTERYEEDANIKLSLFILISMIPALIVGLTLKDQIEALSQNPFLVSVMLLVTGCILFSTKFCGPLVKKLNIPRSFLIGIAQAFAIIPGISRSGSTISMGLYLGIEQKKVANFSFLMVIPVIAGAMLLDLKDMTTSTIPALSLIVGFLTAFVSGYFALKYLIILLREKGIYPFAWYCWVIGVIGLIYFW